MVDHRSTAFIVVEHAPRTCNEFPPNNNVTFTSIVVEVAGKVVKSPKWVTGGMTVSDPLSESPAACRISA